MRRSWRDVRLLVLEAEHDRDARTVDVGVEQADRGRAAASASARLTATVDLPTPPLPLATAMMLRTPGMPCARRVSGVCAGFCGCAGRRRHDGQLAGSGQLGHHARDLVADLVDQIRRIGRRGDRDRRPEAAHLDVADDAEGHDIAPETRIFHLFQGLEHVLRGGRHGSRHTRGRTGSPRIERARPVRIPLR